MSAAARRARSTSPAEQCDFVVAERAPGPRDRDRAAHGLGRGGEPDRDPEGPHVVALYLPDLERSVQGGAMDG